MFLFCKKRTERLWDTPSLLFNGYRAFFFLGAKQPERKADCSVVPPSDKVKKGWRYNLLPLHNFMTCTAITLLFPINPIYLTHSNL